MNERIRGALERHVSSKVAVLQSKYLSDAPIPSAAATLARLRRAINLPPGADPTVWSVMFEDWPDELRPHGDEPTRAERAAHAALTLYAVHQQSKRRDRMHRPDRSLGLAVGELTRAGGSAEAVRRRFDALSTAYELPELLHHARGLITQLRAASIPLDYGLLAAHLNRLQDPSSANSVRLQWARDLYRRPTAATATSSTSLSFNEATTTEESA